jgi:hypothetical protein
LSLTTRNKAITFYRSLLFYDIPLIWIVNDYYSEPVCILKITDSTGNVGLELAKIFSPTESGVEKFFSDNSIILYYDIQQWKYDETNNNYVLDKQIYTGEDIF